MNIEQKNAIRDTLDMLSGEAYEGKGHEWNVDTCPLCYHFLDLSCTACPLRHGCISMTREILGEDEMRNPSLLWSLLKGFEVMGGLTDDQ